MDTSSLIDLILERCEAEHMAMPLKTRLVKLLYLAEIEYYRRTKKRLTKLEWRFHHFGPYARALATHLGNPNIDRFTWSITARPSVTEHDVRKAVADVVHEWGNADLNALLDYVYFETEPMQAAKRGDLLQFDTVAPLSERRPIKLNIDKRKLSDLRKALALRAREYDQLRTPSIASDDLLKNLREWDADRAFKLREGDCKIDPKSLQ